MTSETRSFILFTPVPNMEVSVISLNLIFPHKPIEKHDLIVRDFIKSKKCRVIDSILEAVKIFPLSRGKSNTCFDVFLTKSLARTYFNNRPSQPYAYVSLTSMDTTRAPDWLR